MHPQRPPFASIARRACALLALAAAAPVVSAHAAHAQSPPLQQYYHRSWVGADGPPRQGAVILAKSADGYLWLSANRALIRFDGVRFTVFDSTTVPELAHPGFLVPNQVLPDGTMWITRTDGALVRYRDARFELAVAPSSESGRSMTFDGAGTTWIYGEGKPVSHLKDRQRVRVTLPPDLPSASVTAIVRDTGRGVWLGTRTRGLWHFVDGHTELVRPFDAKSRLYERPLLQSRDGALWVTGAGLSRVVGKTAVRILLPTGDSVFNPRVAVEDASGAVWFGTVGHGVLRWRDGRLEQFTKSDGLSDASVEDLLPERDGSMWIATASGGLDLLRPTPFVTVGRPEGLPFDRAVRIVEDGVGTLWASSLGQLISVDLRGDAIAGAREIVGVRRARLPRNANESYEVLAGARSGGVWLGAGTDTLIRYRDGRIDRWDDRNGLPRSRIWFAHEARDGAVWLGIWPKGFGVMRDGRFSPVQLPGAVSGSFANLVEDSAGRLWVLADDDASLYRVDANSVTPRIAVSGESMKGLGDLALENDETLWASFEGGLARIRSGRVVRVKVLTERQPIPHTSRLVISVPWVWVINAYGLFRVSLDALNAAADGNPATVTAKLFGVADGVRSSRVDVFAIRPLVARHNGQVVAATPDGIAVYDPAREAVNDVPPLPLVEEVEVAGRVIRPGVSVVEIPPNPDRLTIRFTATNVLDVARTRVQYRLDRTDPDWVTSDGPRVATYTQLRPGRYLFHVRAWNEDGVPSTADATLALVVLPAWYERAEFRAITLALFIGVVTLAAVAIHRRRTRFATAVLQQQFEAALAERTRIAQELHDTLLQGFTGLSLQVVAATARVKGPPEAVRALRDVVRLAQQTLADARQAIWDIRSADLEHQSLAEALEVAARSAVGANGVALGFATRGPARRMAPELETAALRIGREAILNALKHAAPTRVEVVLEYAPHQFILWVSDDGRGIIAGAMAAATAAGHWGVDGMRQRAQQAGGDLDIGTEPGHGTVVSLRLPLDPIGPR
jgi:signal transduction histidine kinase/ligand-binding sensor domain-containing protein